MWPTQRRAAATGRQPPPPTALPLHRPVQTQARPQAAASPVSRNAAAAAANAVASEERKSDENASRSGRHYGTGSDKSTRPGGALLLASSLLSQGWVAGAFDERKGLI